MQMTIGKKLLINFGAMFAVVAGMGYGWLSTTDSFKALFDQASRSSVEKVSLAGAINDASSEMLATQRATMLYSFSKDASKVEATRQQFEQQAEGLARSLDRLIPLLAIAESRQITANMRSELGAWRDIYSEIHRLAAAGDPAGALQVGLAKTVPLYESFDRESNRLDQLAREMLERDRSAAEAQKARSYWFAFAMFGLALGSGAWAVVAIRQTNRLLHGVASEISTGAAQVAGAAAQVSSASQQLAQGSTEQAASLEETSASTEEISSMTRRNADHSQSAAVLMQETARHVDEANRKLEQMLASMHDINASSEKISKIIKVIDEIAFQTNILALNAAVEAARAGEAGMGFAVVADEVRSLAQRCAQAARDTTGLIEESIGMASEGSRRVDQVVEAIRFVTGNAEKVKSLIEEVSSGSREQANGIEQVAKTLTEMGQVTQRTAANAEEGAAASAELTGLSETMKRSVVRLHALVGSAGEAAETALVKPRLGSAAPARLPEKAPAGKPVLHLDDRPARPPAAAGKTSQAHADFPLDDDFKEF